jgi:hypothetical protein
MKCIYIYIYISFSKRQRTRGGWIIEQADKLLADSRRISALLLLLWHAFFAIG